MPININMPQMHNGPNEMKTEDGGQQRHAFSRDATQDATRDATRDAKRDAKRYPTSKIYS